MARILALALAAGLLGCASSPPPRTVVVQQVVYVDRSPEPVAKAKKPLKRPRIGRMKSPRVHRPYFHAVQRFEAARR